MCMSSMCHCHSAAGGNETAVRDPGEHDQRDNDNVNYLAVKCLLRMEIVIAVVLYWSFNVSPSIKRT